MYDFTDIVRAADQLAGISPDALIEKMIGHGAAGRAAEREFGLNRSDWKLLSRTRAEFLAEEAARRRLAIDFGAARGWTLSKSGFGLRTLSQGKAHGGGQYTHRNPYPGNLHDQFDHAYFYRRDRRAAAIAAHLYNYPANHDGCIAIANEFGLTFEMPDFPSWWNPGATRLVVYIGPAGSDPSQKQGRPGTVEMSKHARRELAAEYPKAEPDAAPRPPRFNLSPWQHPRHDHFDNWVISSEIWRHPELREALNFLGVRELRTGSRRGALTQASDRRIARWLHLTEGLTLGGWRLERDRLGWYRAVCADSEPAT